MIMSEDRRVECAEMADQLRVIITEVLQDKHLISGKIALVAVLAKMILETKDPANATLFVLDMLNTALEEGQRCLKEQHNA